MLVKSQELHVVQTAALNLHKSVEEGTIIILDLYLRKLRGTNNEVTQVHIVSKCQVSV